MTIAFISPFTVRSLRNLLKTWSATFASGVELQFYWTICPSYTIDMKRWTFIVNKAEMLLGWLLLDFIQLAFKMIWFIRQSFERVSFRFTGQQLTGLFSINSFNFEKFFDLIRRKRVQNELKDDRRNCIDFDCCVCLYFIHGNSKMEN